MKNKKNCGILLSSCAKGSMLWNILISSFCLLLFFLNCQESVSFLRTGVRKYIWFVGIAPTDTEAP